MSVSINAKQRENKEIQETRAKKKNGRKGKGATPPPTPTVAMDALIADEEEKG